MELQKIVWKINFQTGHLDTESLFRFFNSLIEIVEIDDHLDFPRDQKNAKFLECALSTEAEYFITGDKDFQEARKLVNTTILSIAQFKTLICDVW